MKTVLITGASDGIGKAIALNLAGDFSLILCGRDQAKLQEIARQCGENTQILAFDINDQESRYAALNKVTTVDILINNAGVWQRAGDLESLDDATVTNVINTNLTSQILLTKQLLPQIRQRQGSAIINVISKSGVIAQLGQSVYTASKYGMRGFTDVLREDTKNDPVRVAAVYQSGTNTGMFAKAGDDFPTESFTEPEDLAEVIRFMLTRPAKLWINEVRVEK